MRELDADRRQLEKTIRAVSISHHCTLKVASLGTPDSLDSLQGVLVPPWSLSTCLETSKKRQATVLFVIDLAAVQEACELQHALLS